MYNCLCFNKAKLKSFFPDLLKKMIYTSTHDDKQLCKFHSNPKQTQNKN